MTRRLLALAVLTAVTALALTATAGARTVWLCRPGLAHDTCDAPLSTTVYAPALVPPRVIHPRRTHPRLDCFYVYPTVSRDRGLNSDLQVNEERAAAQSQFARFASACRPFAPVYRQMTTTAIAAVAEIGRAHV